MLDLDFFKNYNDRFGHQAGDAALKAVAQATQKALLRDSDRIFRYGGEEFTIILAGAGQYSAMTVAQRILEEVAALDLVHPDSRTGKLTVSIGIAHRSFGEDADICEVLTHADQALYEAKTSGRNRIGLQACSGTAELLGVKIGPARAHGFGRLHRFLEVFGHLELDRLARGNGHRLPRVGIAPQTGRGFRHGQRPDARQDHRRIFKQLPPDVPHNHEHNPFGFHRAHFQSLRYVLDKIFFGRFGSHSQQHLLS